MTNIRKTFIIPILFIHSLVIAIGPKPRVFFDVFLLFTFLFVLPLFVYFVLGRSGFSFQNKNEQERARVAEVWWELTKYNGFLLFMINLIQITFNVSDMKILVLCLGNSLNTIFYIIAIKLFIIIPMQYSKQEGKGESH